MNKKFLFLLLSSSFTLSILYFLRIWNCVEIPDDLKKSFNCVVDSTKEIKFPYIIGKPCNPGVIQCDDEYLMVSRTKSYDILSWIKWKFRINPKNYLCIFKLDKKFNLIENNGNVLRGVKVNNRAGDPRLISFNGEAYVFFNDDVYENEKRLIRMFVGKVVKKNDGNFQIEDVKRLKFDGGKEYYDRKLVNENHDKNWSPFIVDNELYLIYLIEPHVILKVNLENGVCEKIVENSNYSVWCHSTPRGGTPAIQFKDNYITIFHSKEKGEKSFSFLYKDKTSKHGVYCFGAYIFNREYPFNIIKSVDAPISGNALYASKNKIIYPTALLSDNNHFYIFYGEDDRRIFVLTIHKEALKFSH